MNVPYSIIPFNGLKKVSKIFFGIGKRLEPIFPSLNVHLEHIGLKVSGASYISMSLFSTFLVSLIIFILLFFAFLSMGVFTSLVISILVALFIGLFLLLQQLFYPRVKANKKIKEIDRNLLPVLQSMLVQLNSGVPWFNIMVGISNEDYGEISKVFKKAVKEINLGNPAVDVLDRIATNNPSVFFRRSLWQIVNGMKSGADISNVIAETIKSLSEEQLIQIQSYGGQLNPLAMFYMLIAIILPSLGITFLMIMSSFLSATELATKTILWFLFGFGIFFQIMFLGIIRSRRPNLL